MVSPFKALIDFHHRFCPDVSIDSPIVVYELLEKLSKMNESDMKLKVFENEERFFNKQTV